MVSVVSEVRSKLLFRAAYKFEIANFDIMKESDSAPGAGSGSGKMTVKRYCECPV